jgi:hypothetical protein
MSAPQRPGAPAASAPGLAELVSPLTPDAFLAQVLGRKARHFPGEASRFAGLFSFQEMNRLLGMWRLWSERTLKVVLDGRDLPAEEFCLRGQGREGQPALLVDARRLESLLQRGATVVLDAMESLSPGVRDVAYALQSALGGTALCNAYCSFEAHAGFPSHYDTTDVFALHVAGAKRWRVYEGRAPHPVERPGHSYAYQSREHHEQAKGALLAEVEMTPGDVLYLPRGQYHDALATDGASLHLSFGITRATGLDFTGVLTESLVDDALFRAELPHFDDTAAIARHLARLGARLAEVAGDRELAAQVAAWQRERVFRDLCPAMTVPAREAQVRVRVRRGVRPAWRDGEVLVDGRAVPIEAAERPGVEWLLRRELVLVSDLASVTGLDEEALGSLLDRLAGAGVIEVV